MTESELLEQIVERLALSEVGAEIFGTIDARQWPDGALASLVKAKVFRPAQPAQVIECDGCEKSCFKPVHIRPEERARAPYAFIACDESEDMGRIPVELGRLKQWQITGETLAGAVVGLLGLSKPPVAEGAGKRWTLGLIKGTESKGAVTLSIQNGAVLILAGQRVPLTQVLTLDSRGLKAEKAALLRALSGDAPSAWRKQQAKAAADARHSKRGGSRDKQEQMRAIWASGKYSSRDRCAEEECGALGISFSTARKALRNTPKSRRT
jgi:hypothetical protein